MIPVSRPWFQTSCNDNLEKKRVILQSPLFVSGVDFKVFIRNDINCQGYNFNQVLILTPKKGVMLGAPLFVFEGQF